MTEIFIPGNVSSSKNSKQWTGKFLIKSKVARAYEKNAAIFYNMHRGLFFKLIQGKEKPYRISMRFVRDSKRRFDYINAAQLPLDMMVKAGWIEDDNADEIIPIFENYSYNKNDPGLYIKVL